MTFLLLYPFAGILALAVSLVIMKTGVLWRPLAWFGPLITLGGLVAATAPLNHDAEGALTTVSYLFDTTTANRLQAGTELDNVAEQRSLERVGFRREGIQRGLYFRAGAWRDRVMYGLLRADWLSRPPRNDPPLAGHRVRRPLRR